MEIIKLSVSHDGLKPGLLDKSNLPIDSVNFAKLSESSLYFCVLGPIGLMFSFNTGIAGPGSIWAGGVRENGGGTGDPKFDGLFKKSSQLFLGSICGSS